MRLVGAKILLLTSALLLGGCSQDSSPPQGGSPATPISSPQPSAQATASQGAPTPYDLSLSDAQLARENIDYRTIATLKQEFETESAIYYGFDAKAGFAFGSISRPDTAQGLQPRDAIITDLKTHKLTRISNGRTRPAPTQFSGMAYSNGRLVWVETDSDNLSASNWVMYAYQFKRNDPANGTTVELARAPKVGVDPIPMADGFTIPQISGTDVYYNAVYKVTAKKVHTAIYKVTIDGSGPAKLVERNVSGVFADNDWIYFARGHNMVLRRSPTEGSMAEPVKAMDQLRSWCGGRYTNGMFVVCANMAWTKALMVFDSQNRLLASVDLGKQDLGAQTIDAYGDLVAFDAGNGDEGLLRRYVLDLKTGGLRLLDKHHVTTIAHGSGRIQQIRIQPETGAAESFRFVEILPGL